MTVFHLIDACGNSRGEHEHTPGAPLPARYVTVAPPNLDEGEFAVWDGQWAVRAEKAGPLPVEPPDLEAHRAQAMRAIVEHINAVTHSALTAYPAAEVESWPIQKVEAETVLGADTPTLAMAPFLVGVCVAQFGPADDAERLGQVIDKAGAVKANADAWAAMAAYVNGLRARTQIAILAAEHAAGIGSALAAGVAEGEVFKEANGL